MRPPALIRVSISASLLLGVSLLVFGQTVSISLTGDVTETLTLTAKDLASMPRATATVNSTIYEGVWLSYVLNKAGVPLGPNLRGAALATYVLASASDGYQVLFS